MAFEDFFRKATGLPPPAPHDYQRRLAQDELVPELLDVPTGLGKTAAAVLAWLWRRRFAAEGVRGATPRRLVYCLPMRVLVEQTFAETIRWLDRLGMLAGVARWEHPKEKKGFLNYEPEPEAGDLAADSWARFHGDRGLPIAVHLLMGGAERTDWVLWPERDAILIGTQDMLLSRALNRGYAAGRARWPMEFGLLNNDCLWVFDEVQLMGSGLATSLQLQAWRERLRLRPAKDRFPESACNPVFGPARSLWMSATTAKHWFEKAVDWRPKVEEAWRTRRQLGESVGDVLKSDKALQTDPIATLRAPKAEKGDKEGEYLAALAKQVAEKRSPDGVTLVIINTVKRATRLYKLLKDELKSTADEETVHLIHSRFRPRERQGWKTVLSKEDKTPRIIISTQVVEAGVDLSAHVLFTELAPWASLVQRFGRCARDAGESGTVHWMALEGEAAVRPYEIEELTAASEKLKTLADVSLTTLASVSASLNEDTDDARKARGELLPYEPRFVPREKDLFELFDTTPDLTGADIDISRFIRDGRELDVMVYWREVPGDVPGKGERPLREELCPVAFYRFQSQVAALPKHRRIWRRHYRKGWEEIGSDNTETIYPGQVFLLERSCGGYDEQRGWTGDPDDPVGWVGTAASAQPENEEIDEGDDQCEARWLTIAEHCRNVCRLLEEASLRDPEIADAVGGHAKILSLAARWHDRGKAHSVFQAKLKEDELHSEAAQGRLKGEAAAKAPPNAWLPPRAKLPRFGFRHELASALAAMETLRAAQPDHPAFGWPEGLEPSSRDEPRPSWLHESEYKALINELAGLTTEEDVDLFLYLIASHHGKVRMSLRSSPDDPKTTVQDPCPGETPQARGVREDDVLPACNLPGPDDTTLRAPEVCLHLDPMSLGLSDRYGPSWRERTQALLERLGPFRLAYLEALLRAADWRASSEERQQPLRNHGEARVHEEAEEYGGRRESLRDFVRRWAEVGPLLEEERYAALQEVDDERARHITLDLFKLWRPRAVDTMGGGLVEAQKVFIKLARREAAERSSR